MKLPVWAARPRTYAAGLLLSLLAAFGIAAFMIAAGEYTKTRGLLLLTALLLGGCFLGGLVASATPGDGAGRWLRPAALGTAAAATVMLLIGLWGAPGANGFWQAAGIITVLALGLVCGGPAWGLGRRGGPVRAPAYASAASAGLLALLAGWGIALEIRAAPYWWAFTLAALFWLAATAAIPAGWYWGSRGRD